MQFIEAVSKYFSITCWFYNFCACSSWTNTNVTLFVSYLIIPFESTRGNDRKLVPLRGVIKLNLIDPVSSPVKKKLNRPDIS